MPSTGTKQQLKVDRIAGGKRILQDTSLLLNEIYSALKEQDARTLLRLPKKIQLAVTSIHVVQETLDDVLRYDGNLTLSNELISAAVAQENKEKKIIGRQQHIKYARKSEHQVRLEKLSQSSNKRMQPNVVSPPSKKKSKRNINNGTDDGTTTLLSQLLKYQSPGVQGQRYCLYQLVNLTQIDDKSPVYKYPYTKLVPLLTSAGHCVCSKTTLYRKASLFNNDNRILPTIGDEGLVEGRPPMVTTSDLIGLNNGVLNHSGKIETTNDLTKSIVDLQKARGHTMPSTPSRSTIKKYNIVLGRQDGISLVKAGGARPQGVRRQMAGSSVRNCMSQITTLLVSHFVPGHYEVPQDLPEGCILAHKIIEQVAGKEMKPIGLHQIINYDFTSTFFWDGADKIESSIDSWARVSEASQARGARNRTSTWVNNEDIKCNGLTVKWCEGTVASGHLLPQVAIFTGFSETEMPKDSFLVMQVEGMCVNGNLDARNKAVGYIALLRAKQKMGPFFEWYDTKVVLPYFRSLLDEYCNIPVDYDGALDEEVFARIHVDSDMQQIARLVDYVVMQRNYKLGLLFNKIGAKTTMCYQPMDVGEFFKIIRYQSRQSTTKGTDCPLRKTLENGMKQLKDSGRLILTPKKLNAIIDCGATSPKVKGKAYSEQSIKKSYIDTGFINEVDACPNIFGVMKASNVPFSSKPSLEKLFLDSILTCTSEMYISSDGISEQVYDQVGFGIDIDCVGNQYPLTSKSVVLGRAQPIISDRCLQAKTAGMVKELNNQRRIRSQKVSQARAILERNVACTSLLFERANLPATSIPAAVADIPLTIIAKLSSAQLECFVRVRVQKNLLEKWICPTKGTPEKVLENMFCSKTKGKYLIQLVKEVAAQDIIGEIPSDVTRIEVPTMCNIQEPTLVLIGGSFSLPKFSATKAWCLLAGKAVESINQKGLVDSLVVDMVTLNLKCRMFGEMLLSRLPKFVTSRVPDTRPDLQVGVHWHWESFRTKLPQIALLCGLSDHICRGLEYRTADESLLEHKDGTFLELLGELKKADGSYVNKDRNRTEPHRAGASDSIIVVRGEEGHKKYSKLDGPISQQRQQALDYPDASIADKIEGRKGTYDDLQQLCGLGMLRSKRDEVLALFEWNKEEEDMLMKLTWRSSNKDCLENRKYKHLTFLFELTYALAIAPGANTTQNPTGEWELKYFG